MKYLNLFLVVIALFCVNMASYAQTNMDKIRFVPEEFNNIELGYYKTGQNVCSPFYPDDIADENAIYINVPEKIMLNFDAEADSIIVKSLNITRLDTLTTSWIMNEMDVVSFFRNAETTTNGEAAAVASECYSPFSITGEISLNDQDYNYLISPAGIAILTPTQPELNSQCLFYRTADVVACQDAYLHEAQIKVLSIRKRNYSHDDDLKYWCKNWNLTAKQIDDYFALCEKWDESERGSVLTLFDNYNCDITGYLVWDEAIYHYWLWCNGPFLLTAIPDGINAAERYNYVCMNPCGKKYVYTIEENPTLDGL